MPPFITRSIRNSGIFLYVLTFLLEVNFTIFP